MPVVRVGVDTEGVFDLARFKLVKIGKKKVEVQKVRFKVNLAVLLGSFLCAVFVWMYLTGRDAASELIPPEGETHPENEVTETTAGIGTAEVLSWVSGGSVREA